MKKKTKEKTLAWIGVAVVIGLVVLMVHLYNFIYEYAGCRHQCVAAVPGCNALSISGMVIIAAFTVVGIKGFLNFKKLKRRDL